MRRLSAIRPFCLRVRQEGRALLAIAVLSMLAVALHVAANRALSPVDELQHIDQVLSVSSFAVVRDGDRVGQEAMREAACRGIESHTELPACGLEWYDPEDFPERGINTASAQFPVYYAITGFPARLLTAITPIDSAVTAARLMGGLWLGAGFCVLWFLCAEIGASRRATWVTILLFGSTPLILTTASVVNPDNALLLTGGLVALAALRYDRGTGRPWVLFGLSLLSQILEPGNVFVVGLAGAFLVVRAWQRADRRLAIAGAAAVFGAFVVAYTLPQVRGVLIGGEVRASEIPMFQSTEVARLTFDDVAQQFGATVAPVTRPYVPEVLRDRMVLMSITLLTWFVIATVFGSVIWAQDARVRALGFVTAALMVSIGPLVAVHYWVGSGSIIPTPSRYGMPLMAPAMALGAAALTRRSAVFSTAIAGAVAAIAVLTRLSVAALGG